MNQRIGVMMNTRGLMELIVINTGYDLGVISRNVFTMLVLMAIVSMVITTLGLRRWLPKLGTPVPPRRGAGLNIPVGRTAGYTDNWVQRIC